MKGEGGRVWESKETAAGPERWDWSDPALAGESLVRSHYLPSANYLLFTRVSNQKMRSISLTALFVGSWNTLPIRLSEYLMRFDNCIFLQMSGHMVHDCKKCLADFWKDYTLIWSAGNPQTLFKLGYWISNRRTGDNRQPPFIADLLWFCLISSTCKMQTFKSGRVCMWEQPAMSQQQDWKP